MELKKKGGQQRRRAPLSEMHRAPSPKCKPMYISISKTSETQPFKPPVTAAPSISVIPMNKVLKPNKHPIWVPNATPLSPTSSSSNAQEQFKELTKPTTVKSTTSSGKKLYPNGWMHVGPASAVQVAHKAEEPAKPMKPTARRGRYRTNPSQTQPQMKASRGKGKAKPSSRDKVKTPELFINLKTDAAATSTMQLAKPIPIPMPICPDLAQQQPAAPPFPWEHLNGLALYPPTSQEQIELHQLLDFVEAEESCQQQSHNCPCKDVMLMATQPSKGFKAPCEQIRDICHASTLCPRMPAALALDQIVTLL